MIENNPYRILGVFSNATLKEITANKTKLARYASVGKSVSFDADMNGVLPPPSRTAESIEKAFADLSLAQDKLKHALFWFVKDTSFDEMALGHLNAGNVDKAVEILEKRETWSSLLNLGVLAMIQDDYDTAVGNIIQIIREYDGNEYLEKFVACVCGDTFQLEDDDVAHIFIDALLEELEPMEVRRLFIDNGAIVDDDDYIQEKIISAPMNRIKAEISKVKNVDSDNATASYLAGKELIGNTKADLKMMKDVCGDGDSMYGMIADNLAKQILQCGINYFNGSKDVDDQYERIDKAMELQGYALQIAVGPITRGRCKQNVDILQSAKSKLPPKEVKDDFDRIIKLLKSFGKENNDRAPRIDIFARSKAPNQSLNLISNAIELIKNCAPHLRSIKEVLGAQDRQYLSLSTAVAQAALGATIQAVNAAQGEKDIFGNVDISLVKEAFKEGWRATLYMDKLDLEDSFKQGRYKTNRNTLHDLIESLNGFRPPVLSSYMSNNMFGDSYVFGEVVVADLDMRTEQEVFDSCRSEMDFQRFLKNYPYGKLREKAEQKLDVFEKQRWDSCKTLKDYNEYLKIHPYGRYSEEAKRKVRELEEELLWTEACGEDTIEAYQKYLTETKLRNYLQQANIAIERVKEEHRRDEAMWVKCAKKEDYEKYLQSFPRALHKKEADEKLEKIASQRKSLIVLAVFLGLSAVIALSILFG